MNDISRLRIDFQKLINGYYNDEEMLYIYQWLIQLGQPCNKQCGWYRFGLHQSFHGYSHNNEARSIHPLHSDYRTIIDNGFVNILCKTNNASCVNDFLKENRIQLGKIRILKIPVYEKSEYYYKSIINSYDLKDMLHHITTAYKGLLLKREFFHPEYDDRIDPRIIDDMSFGSNNGKWSAWFNFSFKNFDYEPGWQYEFGQKDDESIYSFFDRVIKEMDNLIVYSDNCDNCSLWIENPSSGSVLRHGYRGGCKSFYKCIRPNVEKYYWNHDKPGPITDNAIHYSIEYPYIRERK